MKRILTFAMMLLFTVAVFAQNNDKISYQAVVRTTDNVLVYDQDLTVIIAIANVQGDETGVYGETHNVHSNQNGLISLMIGEGSSKTGSWNAIEWNHAWVTATIKKGSEQLAKHHVPMSAVPYALYAEKVNCDAVNACVGNGKLTITDGTNDNKKEYTANQTGDQTVTLGKTAFTNNYNDLTNKPTIPSAANDGVLTITDGTTTNTKTFTADQATNTTVNLGKAAFTNNYSDLTGTPTISNNTITIKDAAGNTVGSFTLNQITDGTVTLPAINNGKLTITDGTNDNKKEFTANQATEQTVTLGKAAFTNNYNDLTNKPAAPNNGMLTITDGTTTKTFTADQATNTEVTLGKAAFTNNYNDLTNKPTIPSAANDGVLTITDGTTTSTFTANQSTNTTVNLGNGKLTITDGTNDNKKEFTANQATEQTVTLGKAAFTNNYNDLTNKPTIPAAANNSTITIKDAAGNTVGSFTVDQAADGTITLPAQVVPMQKSFRTTYTSGQPKFNLPVPSGKVLDANSYLVQMYINGVYVGDSADGVVTISDGQATYNATPNGGYNLMNGDRVQIVYWVR